jgi:hypothetical protein
MASKGLRRLGGIVKRLCGLQRWEGRIMGLDDDGKMQFTFFKA